MPSTDTHRPGAGPAQVLSLGDATAIIVGLIVGAGIFKDIVNGRRFSVRASP